VEKKHGGDWEAMRDEKPEYAKHLLQTFHADYKEWPLLVVGESEVIDGMHRLTKAWIEHAETVDIKRFTELPADAETNEN